MGSRSRNEGIEVGKRVRLTSGDSGIDTVVEGQVIAWDPNLEEVILAGMVRDPFYVGLGGWHVEVLP